MADGTGASSGAFDRDTAVRRLDRALATERAGELVFSAAVSPAWHAARGPHGGYLAAILLRALTDAAEDQTRQPRWLTIHFAIVKQPGPVRVRTALERRGRSLGSLSARMEQDGKLIALALAAFSIRWQAPEAAELPMPVVAAPGPERATPKEVIGRIEQGLAPTFSGISCSSHGSAIALQRLWRTYGSRPLARPARSRPPAGPDRTRPIQRRRHFASVHAQTPRSFAWLDSPRA